MEDRKTSKTFAQLRAELEAEDTPLESKENADSLQSSLASDGGAQKKAEVEIEHVDHSKLKSRLEASDHEILHQRLHKMQKATDDVIQDNFIDRYMSTYFLHPWARLFVAVGIAFLNFWVLLEDPIAHSVAEANVVAIGQAFSLVATRWSGEKTLAKLFCVFFGFLVGCIFGKKIMHQRCLRGRCSMCRNDKGSLMVMLWSCIVWLYIFSFIFNIVFLGDAENHPQYLSSDMGMTNEDFAKIAGTCCWVGDFLTMFLVIDSMLQDKSRFRKWAPGCRSFWQGKPRILIFWICVPIGVAFVAFIVTQDSAREGNFPVNVTLNRTDVPQVQLCFSCEESCLNTSMQHKYFKSPDYRFYPRNDTFKGPQDLGMVWLNDIKGDIVLKREYGFRAHHEEDWESYAVPLPSDQIREDCEEAWSKKNVTNTACYENVTRSETEYKKFPRINPVCSNPKCIKNDIVLVVDLTEYWFPLEFTFNLLFTVELGVKLFVYPDLSQWFLGGDAVGNFADVVAIVPFYLDLFSSYSSHGVFVTETPRGELNVIKFLRLLSVSRVFKLLRNYPGASVISRTVLTSWNRLILPIFFLLVIVLTFGCILYNLENDPSKGTAQVFPEMLSACWFALVTMTTTGYGRFMPQRSFSKAIAMIMMILGNFYMAMPLTIIGATFWSHYQTMAEKEKKVVEAKEALNLARRKSLRIKKVIAENEAKNKNAVAKVNDAEIKKRMLPPVQEKAYHALFDMEHDIDEILHTVKETEETEAALVSLKLNSRVVDMSRRMAITVRMLGHMIKATFDAASLENVTALNKYAPVHD